jgi:hypothetical protein
MSQVSKIGVALAIGFRRPFAEGGERVVDRLAAGLCQHDASALDAVDDLVAPGEVQRIAHRQRDRRLRLAGQFARDHRC